MTEIEFSLKEKRYSLKPKKDITTYELAQIVQLLVIAAANHIDIECDLEEILKTPAARHFEEV